MLDGQETTSHMGQTKHWRIVVGLLAIVLLPVIYVAVLQIRLRSSEPLQLALSKVRSSEEGQRILGSSIDCGWLIRGEIVPDSSETVVVRVSGSDGRGVLTFRAERVNSTWTFPRLQVWLPHGVRIIDLSDKPPSASSENLHADGRVIFVPLGSGAVEITDKLQKKLSAKLNIPIEILEWVPIDVAEDPSRKQLIAEELTVSIKNNNPSLVNDPNAVIIGITAEDMYIRERDWRFAFSYRAEDRFAIVSSARLDPVMYESHPDPDLLLLRTQKMVTKNIGVLHYHLRLSNDPRSVLYGNVGGIQELDMMGEDFLQSDVATGPARTP